MLYYSLITLTVIIAFFLLWTFIARDDTEDDALVSE
jgi:hypothetical protein